LKRFALEAAALPVNYPRDFGRLRRGFALKVADAMSIPARIILPFSAAR
jgi:hypothetical protein